MRARACVCVCVWVCADVERIVCLFTLALSLPLPLSSRLLRNNTPNLNVYMIELSFHFTRAHTNYWSLIQCYSTVLGSPSYGTKKFIRILQSLYLTNSNPGNSWEGPMRSWEKLNWMSVLLSMCILLNKWEIVLVYMNKYIHISIREIYNVYIALCLV